MRSTYAKLAGRALRIRRAKAGEKLRTLDGVDRALEPDMLVIADAERPQAIGGVMGGAPSEIDSGTKLMVLESAYFKPASVRRTSKRLGLKTEASTRFERGADVNARPGGDRARGGAAAADRRGAAARPDDRQVSGAAAAADAHAARVAHRARPRDARPRRRRAEDPRAAGVRVEARRARGATASEPGDARRRTSRLATSRPTWTVAVPSFRVDVLREVDLIEEIARHDGYVGLPATFPELTVPQPPPDARTLRDRLLRQVLTACGLSEAMTFAFIEARPPRRSPIAARRSSRWRIRCPRSTPCCGRRCCPGWWMRRRTTAAASTTTSGCSRRARASARPARPAPSRACGAARARRRTGPAPSRPADFYDVKGVVEALGRALGVELDYEPASVPYLVEGRAADVFFRLKAEATLRLKPGSPTAWLPPLGGRSG